MNAPQSRPVTAPLLVGALGVVFGDIGTSPLYTLRECFMAAGLALNSTNILGILSLIAWSLFLVVTFKYVWIMMRADNRGEGGILALTTLAIDQFDNKPSRMVVLAFGLIGASLFFGDSLITPAISVLSAVEGLHVITPAVSEYIRPIALLLLILLFGLQRHGTGVVSVMFGPVMLVWFITLGALGVWQIWQHPEVLAALNPLNALHFAAVNKGLAFLTMGSVVLAITGAEALYADMGHFGRSPIQYAWLLIVFPCLLLNYFGQGGLLLSTPQSLSNPFIYMAPENLRLTLVLLATAATIIASQSVISGAYSVAQQAIQLGYLPRMDIRHTSSHTVGQIYIPFLNWLMAAAVTLIIMGFHTSSHLAAAYGIAVTGTMLMSTFLVAIVLVKRNNWPVWLVGTLFTLIFALDATFLSANLHKITAGGWLTLLIGALVIFTMYTWIGGRRETYALMRHSGLSLERFLSTLPPLVEVERTAVFLTSDIHHVPPALLYNVTHNGVWHRQTILIKIAQARIPRYPESERISVHRHAHNLVTVEATYGFSEQPHIPHLLAELPLHGLPVEYPDKLTYFVSTHTYIPSRNRTLNRLQEPVFIMLDRFAHSAVSYYHLPRNRVIEIGNQVEI